MVERGRQLPTDSSGWWSCNMAEGDARHAIGWTQCYPKRLPALYGVGLRDPLPPAVATEPKGGLREGARDAWTHPLPYLFPPSSSLDCECIDDGSSGFFGEGWGGWAGFLGGGVLFYAQKRLFRWGGNETWDPLRVCMCPRETRSKWGEGEDEMGRGWKEVPISPPPPPMHAPSTRLSSSILSSPPHWASPLLHQLLSPSPSSQGYISSSYSFAGGFHIPPFVLVCPSQPKSAPPWSTFPLSSSNGLMPRLSIPPSAAFSLLPALTSLLSILPLATFPIPSLSLSVKPTVPNTQDPHWLWRCHCWLQK